MEGVELRFYKDIINNININNLRGHEKGEREE